MPKMPAPKRKHPKQKSRGMFRLCVMGALAGIAVVSVLMLNNDDVRKESALLKLQPGANNNVGVESASDAQQDIAKEEEPHQVAGLNCDKYGGPSQQAASEMVYWRDIPADSKFVSPYKHVGPETKYFSFEPDEGGWNNIRMSMETAVTLALAMGRTLVMPPEAKLYLLGDGHQGQKKHFSFKDFFHFDSVESEHPAVEVISFEEYLKREALTGHMIDKNTGKVTFPPKNRTNWDGEFNNYEFTKSMGAWLRSFSKTIDWSWDNCLAGFPQEPGAAGVQKFRDIFEAAKAPIAGQSWMDRVKPYINNPTPVDAPPGDRIKEMLSSRQGMCMYDEGFQQAKFVHAMGDNDSGARMLAHFYIFLFFEDWKHDLWTKRFVRDHLRYVDEIQCAAARVVEFLREKARQFGNPNGEFHTMHIRRGDFQYKDTRINSDQIFESVKNLIPVNSTLFIATDERDMGFFKPFHDNYHVYFLGSNPPLIEGINTNFYGMLDQLIASKGKIFVGTFYSTFTGFINRMRGYHSQKEKLPGYEKGIIESYYYVPEAQKYVVREFRAPYPAYWAREFPVGWRDLDRGVEGEIQR